MASVVEGDQKDPFSIVSTPRCRGGRYSFPWIAPLPLIRTWYCWVLSKEVSSTIFKVFGMSRPGIEVSEFEIQSPHFVHFHFGKIRTFLSPSYGLNSITTVLLQGLIWHYITHDDWYAIKPRSVGCLFGFLFWLVLRHINTFRVIWCQIKSFW